MCIKPSLSSTKVVFTFITPVPRVILKGALRRKGKNVRFTLNMKCLFRIWRMIQLSHPTLGFLQNTVGDFKSIKCWCKQFSGLSRSAKLENLVTRAKSRQVHFIPAKISMFSFAHHFFPARCIRVEKRFNVIPCCRQSSWLVSSLHLHIQNLPCDREQKLVLTLCGVYQLTHAGPVGCK